MACSFICFILFFLQKIDFDISLIFLRWFKCKKNVAQLLSALTGKGTKCKR